MHRDYAYGIGDFVTYMELVDFVGGIMGKVLPIHRSVMKRIVFMYVPSSNSVG